MGNSRRPDRPPGRRWTPSIRVRSLHRGGHCLLSPGDRDHASRRHHRVPTPESELRDRVRKLPHRRYRSNRQDGSTRDEFRWPSDVDHPRMRLEVVTQDSDGTIEIELMPELAPASVDELIQLDTRRPLRRNDLPSGDPRIHDPGRRPQFA